MSIKVVLYPWGGYSNPASVPIKQNINNGATLVKGGGGMPMKPRYADNTSSFAIGRQSYKNLPSGFGFVQDDSKQLQCSTGSIRVDLKPSKDGFLEQDQRIVAKSLVLNPKVGINTWSTSSYRAPTKTKFINVQNGKMSTTMSADEHINRRKNIAIGKGSRGFNKPGSADGALSFSANNLYGSHTNHLEVTNAKRRTRNGGYVVPPKCRGHGSGPHPPFGAVTNRGTGYEVSTGLQPQNANGSACGKLGWSVNTLLGGIEVQQQILTASNIGIIDNVLQIAPPLINLRGIAFSGGEGQSSQVKQLQDISLMYINGTAVGPYGGASPTYNPNPNNNIATVNWSDNSNPYNKCIRVACQWNNMSNINGLGPEGILNSSGADATGIDIWNYSFDPTNVTLPSNIQVNDSYATALCQTINTLLNAQNQPYVIMDFHTYGQWGVGSSGNETKFHDVNNGDGCLGNLVATIFYKLMTSYNLQNTEKLIIEVTNEPAEIDDLTFYQKTINNLRNIGFKGYIMLGLAQSKYGKAWQMTAVAPLQLTSASDQTFNKYGGQFPTDTLNKLILTLHAYWNASGTGSGYNSAPPIGLLSQSDFTTARDAWNNDSSGSSELSKCFDFMLPDDFAGWVIGETGIYSTPTPVNTKYYQNMAYAYRDVEEAAIGASNRYLGMIGWWIQEYVLGNLNDNYNNYIWTTNDNTNTSPYGAFYYATNPSESNLPGQLS